MKQYLYFLGCLLLSLNVQASNSETSVAEAAMNAANAVVEAAENGDSDFDRQIVNAQNGNINAQLEVAKVYLEDKNYPQAIQWMRKAANANNAEALYHLGEMYLRGYGVAASYREGGRLIQKSADNGYAEAILTIAMLYRDGSYSPEIPQSTDKALYYFKKLVEMGDSRGAYNLGHMYSDPRGGVNKSVNEAFKWFLVGANQGDYLCADQVAYMYEKGLGTQKSIYEAENWYVKGIELRPLDQRSLMEFILGVKFKDGDGVIQSNEKARFWLQKALDDGFTSANEYLDQL